MENKLAAFIAGLATSPEKLEAYLSGAESAMAGGGLSEEEKEVLRSGKWDVICEFMSDPGPRPVTDVQGPQETGGTGDSGSGSGS